MPTTEERLATIEANTTRILRALDGNGRPGLVERTAKLEELTKGIEEDVQDIRGKRTRSGVAGGVAGGGLIALVGGLVTWLRSIGVSI